MSDVPRVLRHNICVKLIEQEETTPGGIYMPQKRIGDRVKGEVVAIGTGHLLTSGDSAPIQVAIGETVVFNENEANEVISGTEKFFVLPESSIICVL